MADWEIALAIAEDRAEEAERELAAIRWRHQALRAAGPLGTLFLDPVTSTTDEVCDHLAEWARMQAEVLASFEVPPRVMGIGSLDEVLAGIERARLVYA